MTSEWGTLVTTALLGSERAPGVAELPAELSAFAPKAEAAERRVLANAALLSPWMRAGQELAAGSASHAECERDDRRQAYSLAPLLTPDHESLMLEWCTLAAAGNRCVAYHLLPEFLDRLQRERDRPTIAAMRQVLGARGAWLAQANPAWRGTAAAAGADAGLAWQSGTRAERLAQLQQLRLTAPAEAPALIASSMEADAPDDVAAYVAELRAGLSMADHDFLEGLLDARHKPIRAAAASLLAGLPDSKRSARMVERMSERVTFTPGGLIRKRKGSIDAKLADKEEAAWAKAAARDGLEAKKRGQLGPKAHMLLQMTASTPLRWWKGKFDVDPADLIEAALEGEWGGALLIGWSEAAALQGDVAWAQELVRAFGGRAGGLIGSLEGNTLASLFRVMAPPDREAFLQATFEERPRAIHDGWILHLLEAADHPWSAQFSEAFLETVRAYYLYDTPWGLRATLVRIAARLSPQCAATIRDGWPTDKEQWTSGDTTMLDRVAATLELRRHYLQELKP